MLSLMRNLLAGKTSTPPVGKPIRHPARKPAPRARLELEALEARTVPTVVFNPKYGAEKITGSSQGMQHPDVNLIFAGPYWTQTAQGQQDEQTLYNAASSILNGPYLSRLTQYGSDGRASLNLGWNDPTAVAGNPSTAVVREFLQLSIYHEQQALQGSILQFKSVEPGHLDVQHAPIYVVISDPVSSGQGNNGGWNAPSIYWQVGWPANMHMIWVGTTDSNTNAAGPVSKDFFTSTLSHELAETISDPGFGGAQVTPPSNLPASLNTPNSSQIGDYEPTPPGGVHYGYRLNGNLVQPYWSYQDNAFVVPDGSWQNFTLIPLWPGGTFSGQYTLSVSGGQYGAGYADTIRIGSNPFTGGVQVTMNGESVTFDNGAITSINVNAPGGSNSVQVGALPAGVTANVDGTFVLTGPTPDLVVNAATNDSVAVNSAADGSALVTASGQTVSFNPGLPHSITINAVGGQNSIRILGVPSGVGVNIKGSLGGVDNVTIGNGTLASVGGPVSVSNTSGNVTIDDSADTVSRYVTVTNGFVRFAGLSPVTYSGTNSSLTVRGGSGNNSFFVLSTAGGTPLSVVTGAGQNSVSVGNNGSLAGIAAAVNVQHNSGSGTTDLSIDDHNEYGRSAYVNSSEVAFAGVAPVTFSGINSLEVVGASGYNGIDVDSVPSGVPVTIYNTESNYVYGPAWWQVTQVYYLAYYVPYSAYGYFVG